MKYSFSSINIKRTGYCLVILLCGAFIETSAQKEGNIWYFGERAGLDFNSGHPVPLNNSAMYQREGCAVISDTMGNLMFYTNGQNVWNKHGAAMGTGQLLTGGQSATQSAIIAKKPGNNSLYYIFTVPDLVGTNGLRTTIVDMSLNGGNGNFTSTMNATLNAAPTEEKVTAVAHQNGKDIWIITHLWDSDAFYAFLLTENGIDKDQAVISHIGLTHQGTGLTAGYMKASPDGSKLAIITRTNNSFQLFDFNNQTGDISNPITFLTQYPKAYGIEFSPSGKMLYVSDYSTLKKVTQFDLTLPEVEMINSGIVVGTVSNAFIGAMQIAPDGKIYVSKFDSTIAVPFIADKYLGAITFPEKRGIACQFVEDDLFLGNGACILGLPTFVQSYFFQLQNFSSDSHCSGDTTRFILSNVVDLNKALWDFGDPGTGSLNQDTSFYPYHVYHAAGEYRVKLISYFAANNDTLIKAIVINPTPVINLGDDRNFCSNLPLILNATNQNSTYRWQDGSIDSTYNVSSSGTYHVTVTNEYLCASSDSVDLILVESPLVDLGNDTVLNVGETITLQVQPGYQMYTWSDGSQLNYLVIDKPGTYWVEVENNGCYESDTIQIIFESHCRVYCPNAFTPNGDGRNDTFQPIANEPLLVFHLVISSRWGTIVFTSNNLNDAWDGYYQGKLVELGAYAWFIEYQCQYTDENKVTKGTVMVIR